MPTPMRTVAPVITAATVLALVFGTGAMTASADGPTLAATIATPHLTLPLSDGFEDSSIVTITSPDSTDATVTETNGSTVFTSPLIPLSDDGNGGFTGTFNLATLAPTAGTYAVSVDQGSASASATDSLVVGSGQARTVLLTPSATSLLTNTTPPETLSGTVIAKDETGEVIPVTDGSYSFTDSAGASLSGSLSFPTAPATTASVDAFSVNGFASGTAELTASGVTGPDDTYNGSSNSAAIDLEQGPALTGATVTESLSTVYPHKDGYKDSVKFTVAAQTTTTGVSFNTTGTIVLKKGTKTEATLPFTGTSNVANVVTWNGLVKKKVVTGTYTATATLTAPSISPDVVTSAPIKIVVSGKKLHRHSVSITQSASTFFSSKHDFLKGASRATSATKSFARFAPSDRTQEGEHGGKCSIQGSSIHCSGTGSSAVAFRLGYLPIPAHIRRAASLKTVSAHLSFQLSQDQYSAGHALYLMGSLGEVKGSGSLKPGTTVTKAHNFASTDDRVVGEVAGVGHGAFTVSHVKTSFVYFTLS